MILVRDLTRYSRRRPTVVLTGDGEWEYRVLKGLCEKFDGRKHLWFPKTPLPYSKTGTGKPTGRGIYGTVKLYVEKYDVRSFVILYDREHFDGIDEDLRTLSRLGFTSMKVETVKENKAFVISCRLGPRDVIVHVSVQGKSRCLDEEIAELIKAKYGVELKPNKKEIKRFLKAQEVDGIEDLVKQSSIKYLKRAFEGLCAILEVLEASRPQ